jgi:hypothetical protein
MPVSEERPDLIVWDEGEKRAEPSENDRTNLGDCFGETRGCNLIAQDEVRCVAFREKFAVVHRIGTFGHNKQAVERRIPDNILDHRLRNGRFPYKNMHDPAFLIVHTGAFPSFPINAW